MKLKACVFTLLAFLIMTLEATLLHKISLNGIMPNLSAAFIVIVSLLCGSTVGRRLGLFVGLLQDVLFLNVLGFYMLIFFLIGQLCGMLKNGFESNNLLFALGIVAAADFVYAFLSYFFIHFFRGRIDASYYLVHRILAEVVYTLPFAVILFILIRGLDRLLTRVQEKHLQDHSFEMVPIDVGSEKN